MSEPPLDIAALSAEERLDLIEQLWDSLDPAGDVPVTASQRAELVSRLEALERGEMKTVPLEPAASKRQHPPLRGR